MSYTIIIPSRNAENLKACLRALNMKGNVADTRVIVDADSEMEAGPLLKALEVCAFAKWMPGISPFCFARNMNRGINSTSTDVVLLNDDAQLENFRGFDVIELLAKERPEFGLISAAVRGPVNSPEVHPCIEPWPLARQIREVTGKMIPFVAVYIPRRTIDNVGLLDERFTGYGYDDNDYCRRVRNAGLKIGVYDGCVVDHGTLPSTFRPDGKGRDVSEMRKVYVDKWGDLNG